MTSITVISNHPRCILLFGLDLSNTQRTLKRIYESKYSYDSTQPKNLQNLEIYNESFVTSSSLPSLFTPSWNTLR
jgi:hypothetical protein